MKTIVFKTHTGATYTIVKPKSMAELKADPVILPAEDAKKFNKKHPHKNLNQEPGNEQEEGDGSGS